MSLAGFNFVDTFCIISMNIDSGGHALLKLIVCNLDKYKYDYLRINTI